MNEVNFIQKIEDLDEVLSTALITNYLSMRMLTSTVISVKHPRSYMG